MLSLRKSIILPFMMILVVHASCSKEKETLTAPLPEETEQEQEQELKLAWQDRLNFVLYQAELPSQIANTIAAFKEDSPFMQELSVILRGDPYLRLLIDKSHALPTGYEPDDLVELEGGAYRVSRSGLMLRKSASDALLVMAQAALEDNVILTASSAYRSYDYQALLFARNVREMGEAAASRESSRPGYSQHQSGLAVDFGSIDDSFAQSSAGKWVLTNAARFGWSLSFPDGYEEVTGYRWESWHYRYVGVDLCRFIDNYFEGIQQYALRFIYEWELLHG